MSNPETILQQTIRLALGTVPGLVLWRNTTGHTAAWTAAGQCRHITYGLGPGSADLIGCLDGRFVALEVKTPRGRVSPDQIAWMNVVRANGGFAAVVRSVEDACEAIARARKGEAA